MTKFSLCYLCAAIALFAVLPLQAELRDPTRPSGVFNSMDNTVAGEQFTDGLHLQAIFFNPVNPAALINGRRFVVGDQVGEDRVQVIYADRVVLTGASGTKELGIMMPSVKTRASGNR